MSEERLAQHVQPKIHLTMPRHRGYCQCRSRVFTIQVNYQRYRWAMSTRLNRWYDINWQNHSTQCLSHSITHVLQTAIEAALTRHNFLIRQVLCRFLTTRTTRQWALNRQPYSVKMRFRSCSCNLKRLKTNSSKLWTRKQPIKIVTTKRRKIRSLTDDSHYKASKLIPGSHVSSDLTFPTSLTNREQVLRHSRLILASLRLTIQIIVSNMNLASIPNLIWVGMRS